MLKKVIITNYLGETAEYKIEGVQPDDESGLFITSVDGLGPVKATINMMDLATTDGQLYNSARLSGRNIVIKAFFTEATSIEEARLLSYKYFPIKSKVNIKIVTDNRTAETNGYVESNEPDIFSEREGCQISILCENPYFDGGQISYIFNDTIPEFSFPFGNGSLDENLIEFSRNSYIEDEREFFYEGDADSGMEIEVSIPSDDIMDRFNVSGTIEINGENDQKIRINTSKFSSQIANSMPVNDLRGNLLFTIDADNNYEYYATLPVDNSNESMVTFIKDDELYILKGDSSNACRFFKANKSTHVVTWDELQKYPNTSISVYDKIFGAFVYDGKIHICHYGPGSKLIHATWDEENGWQNVNDLENIVDNVITSDEYISHMFYFRNDLHFFACTDSGINDYGRHFVFNRYYQEWREDLSFKSFAINTHNARIVPLNQKIHIFAGQKNHYTWESGYETLYVDQIPSTISSKSYISKGFATVFKNEIHIFPGYALEGGGKEHYVLNDNGEWRQLGDSPDSYLSSSVIGCDFSDSRFIYIVNNNSGDPYTASPDNVCLTRLDRLVINTNKGKKSVILNRDGKQYNVINSLDKGPSWLQIHRGTNKISYDATEGSEYMQVKLTTNKWYEGV